ncbi:hypothetical protein SteCoe_10802 [Stentor coeruleus]|uniref:DUF4246 domain-containing protein n=1 Tax=Stentor coeruleus TaxID=5963 RepID=A0A1R2CEN5_9CILI|nr:hypothetical protein SteCoe_10802 [Stentor coeruleus]
MEKLTIESLYQILKSTDSIPVKVISSQNKKIKILVTKVNLEEDILTGYCKGEIADINNKNYYKLLNVNDKPTSKSYELNSGIVLHTLSPFMMYLSKKSNIQLYTSTEFRKIGWDTLIYYGSNISWLIYPLYFAENLQLSDRIKEGLVKKLNELGETRQDWHEEYPVLDIIDPDLAPNYYYSSTQVQNLERFKYQWFPTDILITPDLDIKLLGPIHNLSFKDNKDLYSYILEVFKNMLPGFNKLGFLNGGTQKIQVVFKAQKHVIQPGASYSGKWHLEGKTENIIAGGVYYCKIDPRFEKDEVIFMPRKAPDSYYTLCSEIITKQKIYVHENLAFVFLNCIPNKSLKLTNITTEPLERMFLNFYIVDPNKPIESTSLGCEAEKALIGLKKFPKVIVEEILSFLVFRPNIGSAKELRRKARYCMQNETTGWRFVRHGYDKFILKNFGLYINYTNNNNNWTMKIQEVFCL